MKIYSASILRLFKDKSLEDISALNPIMDLIDKGFRDNRTDIIIPNIPQNQKDMLVLLGFRVHTVIDQCTIDWKYA